MGVQPRFLQGWQEESHASAAVPFGRPVARYLKPPAGKWQFHCMVIAAHRGDGITTTAAQAEQHARKIVGTRAVARLTGDDQPRLAITDLLSPLTVVRAATKAGVDPARPVRQHSWLALLGAAAAFALAAGLSLLTSATANGTLTADETRRVLTNPWYLAVAAIGGVAAVTTERLLHLRSSVTGERLDRITRATTTTSQTQHPAREHFIALLATALLDDRNRRCLIVEDYARLDTVSQAAIRHALDTIPTDRPELWIVFESADLSVDPNSPSATLVGDLGRHVLAERQSSPARPPTAPALRSHATLLFELKHLTADQRRQLVEDAATAGQPANPSYIIIKDVLTGDATASERDAFKRAWPPAAVRADTALHEALALLYLLSISAPPGYAVTFPLSRLPADLSAPGPHRDVLHLLLHTRPTLDTIRRRLDRALRIFTRFVEQDQTSRPAVLRLSPAIQDVLTPQNADYDLPSADRVHLFWALYRFDRASPDRATWLDPQIRHLREAAGPSTLGSRSVAKEVAKPFGAALLAVIDACLDLGRLRAAADLLDRAFDLCAEPGFPLDPAALRERARALYAVSTDPAPLARAAATVAASISTGEPVSDLLIDLFEQATPGVGHGALARLLGADEALTTDLRLRAVWLALSLQPLTDSALPRDLPLSRTVIDAHLALPLLTQRALDEADAQAASPDTPGTPDTDEWSPAPLIAVTTALWCLALADETLTQPIHSQIDTGSMSIHRDPAVALSPDEWSEWTSTVDIYLAEGLEHGLYLARAKPPAGLSYAHAGVRSELLVVVVAAAIRVRLTWTSVQRARERRLDAVILDGCHELGIAVPQTPETAAAPSRLPSARPTSARLPSARLTSPTLLALAERVAKRMTSIQVTWTALGYPRAAAALNTRRVQFLARLPDNTHGDWQSGDQQSRDRQSGDRPSGDRQSGDAAALGDRGSNDLFGLIANLAVASDTAAHPSIRAEIVAASVGRLLVAGQLDEALAAQLCLLTVRLASVYTSVDISRQLRYLAEPPDDGTTAARLDVLLGAIAESELDTTYIHLVNVAKGERAGAVIRALRRRSARVADPAVARSLRTRLDIYDLMRAVASSHGPDIDATLDAWNDRKTAPGYAFVLYLLMPSQNTAITERLQREAGNVLHDPHAYFAETGILLLANSIALAEQARSVTVTATESADLVRVLRAGAHRVGRPSVLPLSEAIATLRHLFRLDPANASNYRAPLLDLQRNTLKLLGEQQLTRLLAGQQYAALLRTYYEMFREFLPIAEDPGNGHVTAFVGDGRQMLNAGFLRDLFDPDEQVRARADVLTRNALIRVLSLLAEVPDMPADMAELLRQHRVLIQQASGSDVSL